MLFIFLFYSGVCSLIFSCIIILSNTSFFCTEVNYITLKISIPFATVFNYVVFSTMGPRANKISVSQAISPSTVAIACPLPIAPRILTNSTSNRS